MVYFPLEEVMKMENRDNDIKQEVIWRDASASEHECIRRWSKAAYAKKIYSLSLPFSLPVIFAVMLDIFLYSEGEDVRTAVLYTAVFGALFLFFDWALLSSARGCYKAIAQGKYKVTEVSVTDKITVSRRYEHYYSIKVKYSDGDKEEVKIYDGDKYNMYDRLELGTSVLLIDCGEDLTSICGSDYDCVLPEAFTEKAAVYYKEED